LGRILEDKTTGFGFDITVTDPAAAQGAMVGYSNDIGQMIDPDTGQAVSGRRASVALRISSLVAAGFGLPEGIADSASKPWVVEFLDIGGTAHKFKVQESHPDRTIGAVTCLLERYE
jgi:hypothetical protein